MQTAQSPARPTAAEQASVDAQLELAAKKAALRSLEAQAGGPPAAEAPAAPAGRVVIVSGDKTYTLDNPTPEQLAQLGGGAAAPLPAPDPRMIITLTSITLTAIVAVVWMILHYRRGGKQAATPRESAEMAARMARIENAVESVAVEVERISEGQRFAARMLAEGAAVPVAVPDRGEANPQQRMERQP
jgi:hypothetical protein